MNSMTNLTSIQPAFSQMPESYKKVADTASLNTVINEFSNYMGMVRIIFPVPSF